MSKETGPEYKAGYNPGKDQQGSNYVQSQFHKFVYMVYRKNDASPLKIYTD